MRQNDGPAKQTAPPASGNPCIEITPSPAEYRQLCRDLAALRNAGAESNTSAILAAVRAAADGRIVGGTNKRRAAQQRPRHGNRR